MTMRDYFAAKAMQADLTILRRSVAQYASVAVDAYRMADAMLEAREK